MLYSDTSMYFKCIPKYSQSRYKLTVYTLSLSNNSSNMLHTNLHVDVKSLNFKLNFTYIGASLEIFHAWPTCVSLFMNRNVFFVFRWNWLKMIDVCGPITQSSFFNCYQQFIKINESIIHSTDCNSHRNIFRYRRRM